MRKILLLPLFLGIAAAITFAGLLITDSNFTTHDDDDALSVTPPLSVPFDDVAQKSELEIPPAIFTYYDTESVSDSLMAYGLLLSVPVPVTDHTISKYCTYYNGTSEKFESVSYCTTSGISDKNGITVGNFNLGGDISNPVVSITVLDPVLSIETGHTMPAMIFAGVIEGLVCDCWAEKKPGGFTSVLEWMSKSESILVENPDKTSLKSTIGGLADGVTVTLEATALSNGYQWSLVILQQQPPS